MQSSRPTIPIAFRERVLQLLAALRWTKVALAQEMRVSPAQVSGWLKDQRTISRADVNKMALAIAHGAHLAISNRGRSPADGDSPSKLSGGAIAYLQEQAPPGDLDAFVLEMLALADYGPLAEPRIDRFWHSISADDIGVWGTKTESRTPDKVLRIAWFNYPPLARDGSDRKPVGLSRITCDRIARLLALEPEYVRLEISEVESALASGEVQMIAPLLAMPARRMSMAFSRPLPELGVGLEAVVPVQQVNEASPPFPEGFEVGYAAGGVALPLLHLEMPDVDIGRLLPHAYKSLDDWHQLVDKPIDPQLDRPRCFIADEITAIEAAESSQGRLQCRLDDKYHRKVALHLALAVHPRERSLLAAVNSCLEILDSSIGNELSLFQEEYRRMEESTEIADRKVIRRVQRYCSINQRHKSGQTDRKKVST